MKKSIKKACSIALLLTSTTALAGVNAVVLSSNRKGNQIADVHAEQTLNTLTVLEVEGKNKEALLGSDYTIPNATLIVNGTESAAAVSYEVISPIGETVNVDGGKITLNRIGTYVINYSVENGGKTYTASTTVNVNVGSNSIKVKTNTQRILPKYVYQSYTGNLYIPTAEVEFAENSVEQNYSIETIVTSPSQQTLTFDEATGKLTYTSLEEGTYSVRYVATNDSGVYLNSLTQEFTVLSDAEFEKEYGKDYTLKFDYSKTVPTSADIGEELDLPVPTGKIGTTETPVYYTIEAYVYVDGKTVDVTDQTINGNKFTAKKVYNIGGQTYNATNSRYLFYYNVTDALGKKAERTGFEISGVKDTKAPKIVVADPYSTDATSDIVNVDYKLQTNFTNGKNIVLKAIFAKDLADEDLSNLELTRYIRKSTQSSTSEDIYTDAGKDALTYTKDIVFNKTDDFAFDANTMVDGGELEDGTYTAYYKAKDSAGNVVTESYTFSVDKTFEFTKAPTVEFKDTFPKSINMGEKITFSAPVASDEKDDRLYTQVMYKYNGDANWTTLSANDNGKYEIAVNQEGKTSLTIRAKTENDAPLTSAETNADSNIAGYAGYKYGYDEVEILIKDNQDASKPEIVSLSDLEASYNQNDVITLPTLTLRDDLVDYVDVNITVTNKEAGQDFDVDDAVIIRTGDILTLSNANFFAVLEGNYDIVYEITDAANNKAYIYQSINVNATHSTSEPKFSNLPEALSNGKLELGDSISLPVPELPSEEYEYFVNVRGPVGSQLNKETFTPRKAGTYTLVYQMYLASDTNHENVIDSKEFKVVVSDTKNPEMRVEWNLNDSYAKGSKVLIPVFSASDISGIDMESSKVVISSNSYTRTIKANEMADLLAQYNGWLDEENKIKAGTLTEHSSNFATAGDLYVTLNYNELYTVTYTAYDNSVDKNSTVKSFTIKVGDLVAPTVTVKDDIVANTVKIDTKLSIDLSKITVDDNITENMSANDIKIVVKNTTTGTTLKNLREEEDGKFEYNIDTAGDYTVTFSATDDAGNTKTVTRTFTVNEPNNNGASTNEIITIVLCCVAVVVLAGAIVYMVVSKKKTDAYKK